MRAPAAARPRACGGLALGFLALGLAGAGAAVLAMSPAQHMHGRSVVPQVDNGDCPDGQKRKPTRSPRIVKLPRRASFEC